MVRGSDSVVFRREAKLLMIVPFAVTVIGFVLARVGPRLVGGGRESHRAAVATTSVP